MSTTTQEVAGSRSVTRITVTLNTRPVVFQEHQATGAEIKTTAIRQGVAIQPDFVLFEKQGPSHQVQIGDNNTVTLHEKQAFRAVAADDNS